MKECRLERFVTNQLQRNHWVRVGNLDAYVRKAHHGFAGKAHRCLDIANVVVEVERRGQGQFTRFLARAEELVQMYGFDAVYVENVMNDRLADFLEKRGYTKIDHGLVPSFYFIPPHATARKGSQGRFAPTS